jgi:apolipoprotein N-acyltransferase
VWVIGECASTAAGAPWSIALTQTAHLPLLQSAALLGGFWIAFLVVLVNRAAAMLGVALLARRRGSDAGAGWRSAAALAGIATGGTLLFGAWTLSGDASGPALRVASIQPVIASELYRYQAMLPAARRQVRALVAQLSADALVARPDVLVWPEGGNGEFNFRVPALRQEIGALARASGAALLISSHDVDARGRLFNSVFSVLPSGAVAGRYDKVRLTPSGEEAFAAGRAWAPLPTVGGPVGALLCFESVLPQAARALVAQGARWLLITASDVAFRNSSLALLHARFAVLRAVENQRAVVQASNGGPSLVIAPSGAVRAQTALLARGAVTGTVPLRDEHTPYTRWGDVPLLALCGLVVAAALAQRPRRGGPRRCESGASAPRARGPGVGAVVGWLGVAVAAGLLLAVASLLRTSAAAGSASDPLTAFLRPAAINWSPDAAQEFRQSAENTCGPAALAMLASYLGMNVHEREVVPLVALTPSGTSMAELAAAARRLGFGAWGERQDLAGLRTTPKPVIAHVAGNHYVVVLALSDAGVDLFDPAVGYRRLSTAEFTRVWQGHVLVVRFADDADTGWSR